MSKILATALLSAALLLFLPGTPVNNSETKVAHTAKAEQRVTTQEAEVTVAVAEMPTAPPPESQPEVPETVQPPIPTTHIELMAAAGISPKDYGAADYIISRESSWNENATNPTSGAHGLIQALPYAKTGCDGTDAVCQLKWGNAYAVDRYGSWKGAYAFWRANHWW